MTAPSGSTALQHRRSYREGPPASRITRETAVRTGENSCPPVGTSRVHHRGVLLSAYGENLMSAHTVNPRSDEVRRAAASPSAGTNGASLARGAVDDTAIRSCVLGGVEPRFSGVCGRQRVAGATGFGRIWTAAPRRQILGVSPICRIRAPRGVWEPGFEVVRGGVEPPTPRFSGARNGSNLAIPGDLRVSGVSSRPWCGHDRSRLVTTSREETGLPCAHHHRQPNPGQTRHRTRLGSPQPRDGLAGLPR